MRILLLGANGQLGRTFLDHGGLTARGELTVATRDGALTHGGHGETLDEKEKEAAAPAAARRWSRRGWRRAWRSCRWSWS